MVNWFPDILFHLKSLFPRTLSEDLMYKDISEDSNFSLQLSSLLWAPDFLLSPTDFLKYLLACLTDISNLVFPKKKHAIPSSPNTHTENTIILPFSENDRSTWTVAKAKKTWFFFPFSYSSQSISKYYWLCLQNIPETCLLCSKPPSVLTQAPHSSPAVPLHPLLSLSHRSSLQRFVWKCKPVCVPPLLQSPQWLSINLENLQILYCDYKGLCDVVLAFLSPSFLDYTPVILAFQKFLELSQLFSTSAPLLPGKLLSWLFFTWLAFGLILNTFCYTRPSLNTTLTLCHPTVRTFCITLITTCNYLYLCIYLLFEPTRGQGSVCLDAVSWYIVTVHRAQ